jgi:predicted dehydrogenase
MSNNNIAEITIIGSGSQANKIYDICKKIKQIKKINRYHYKQKKNFTNDFTKILFSKCVFIASPTYSHFDYLKKLKKFNGYIFLEKPGGSSLRELKYLKNTFINGKIFINYNFQFSNLYELLKKLIKNKKFGKLVKVDISATNGLIHKKNYKNWRFKKNFSIGIEEINTVHFLKLSESLFGKSIFIDKKKFISKKSLNTVTANYSIETNKKVVVNIFNSYNTVYSFHLIILFENAMLKYDGKKISIFYPRNVFDKYNRFISPPKINSKNIDFEKDWKESLNKSIIYFLNKVLKKHKLSKKDFENSIEIAEQVFK